MTDSHVKLYRNLDDMQELYNNSHHKKAFDYNEDTMSLVKNPTLTTSGVPLSNNSDISAGYAPLACKYYCYEIEADTS